MNETIKYNQLDNTLKNKVLKQWNKLNGIADPKTSVKEIDKPISNPVEPVCTENTMNVTQSQVLSEPAPHVDKQIEKSKCPITLEHHVARVIQYQPHLESLYRVDGKITPFVKDDKRLEQLNSLKLGEFKDGDTINRTPTKEVMAEFDKVFGSI